jgi:hypothetical protein
LVLTEEPRAGPRVYDSTSQLQMPERCHSTGFGFGLSLIWIKFNFDLD